MFCIFHFLYVYIVLCTIMSELANVFSILEHLWTVTSCQTDWQGTRRPAGQHFSLVFRFRWCFVGLPVWFVANCNSRPDTKKSSIPPVESKHVGFRLVSPKWIDSAPPRV